MSSIKDAFVDKKAFIAYLMAGDPSLDATAGFMLAAQEAGADLLEVGIPFSDPIAEGEVIQAASIRALEAGARLDGIFDMVFSTKEKMHIPVVFMTYLNPVFVYGYERFLARCAEIGVCGLIIPDLPFEEQLEVKTVADGFGVEIVTLIAPTSSERISRIAQHAEGFIYLVSSMGVTGMRSEISTDVAAIYRNIRRYTDIPVAVGFGIAQPEQAKEYSKIADGVIVGSAIVDIIAKQGANAIQAVYDYIREMQQSIR
ncbi:MAG: tryptophan synthase subunit alpha [Coriobacteriia bacterium]|nr:tryptophan synthase subunit alpha [Coriobacteriia bacterium]MCL2137121.1 tryptophan synthase subunit alpha [Coriobacteriia bacterium]